MKVVILGAGASRDCVRELFPGIAKQFDIGIYATHEHPWVPPLGNELFSTREVFRNILATYPGANSFTSIANSVNDLEEYLDEIQGLVEKTNDPIYLSQLVNMRFYLQELLYKVSIQFEDVGLSNYESLIDIAYRYAITKNDAVCFISFNYDFLLENAFEKKLKTKINTVDDYIKNARVKIIKPHGSCNWVRKIKKMTQSNTEKYHLHTILYETPSLSQKMKAEFEFDSGIELQHYEKRDCWMPNNNAFFHYMPQIVLPLKTKTDFLLPEKHLKVLEESLQSATDILTIGWKAGEQKFLTLMKENLKNRSVNISIVDKQTKIVRDNIYRNVGIYEDNFSLFDHHWKNKGDKIQYEHGTFSSYIMNVLQKKEMRMFKNIF